MTANGKPGTALASRGTLLESLGAKYLPGTPKAEVLSILQQTAFKTGTDEPPASSAQVAALLVVADQYGLNPWTKEIYAFPDKKNGIVPVVGVDGWNRIANEHPQFAGETLELPPRDEWLKIDDDAKLAPPWMRVLVYRKDRDHPTDHTEYLDECYREAFTTKSNYKVKGPWQSHTKRMLEHKARIQARRIAFGFSGIYDQDEAERIVEGEFIEGVGVEEETGQVIGQAEYDALLAEMKRTQISLESIAKNVAAKAGYKGELADMPLPVWESLMAGLATMPTNGPTPPDNEPTTATRRPLEGVATPNGSDEAQGGSSDAASEDGEAPGRGALTKTTDPVTPARQKLFDVAWDKAINEGADEGELLAAVCDAVEAPTLEGLTMGQAQAGLTYLKAHS